MTPFLCVDFMKSVFRSEINIAGRLDLCFIFHDEDVVSKCSSSGP